MFKVGIAGCGRIANSFDNDPKRKYISTHIGAYKHVKDTRVVAICDIIKEKTTKCLKKWNIPRGYTNIEEMLKKEKIDILSICTPAETHYPVLKEAVKFPLKAIFCEKPLSDSLKDAKKMVKLCEKKKIILQVGHQRRFDPLHLRIRDIIRRKKLDKVQQVNFYYTAGIKNTGSHMFDLLRFLFGDVKEIEAVYSRNPSHRASDPNLDGILRFKNGILATFQACDVKKYLIFELDCLLQKGRIIVKDAGFSVDYYVTGKNRYFSGYNELCKKKAPFNVAYKRNFMVNAVDHLIKCIREDRQPISSGIDGLKALNLIESALYSAKNDGKRIMLG